MTAKSPSVTKRLAQLTGDPRIDSALRSLSAIMADIASTTNAPNQEIEPSKPAAKGGRLL